MITHLEALKSPPPTVPLLEMVLPIFARYKQSGRREDLEQVVTFSFAMEEAMTCYSEVLGLRPPDRPTSLDGFANVVLIRYRLFGRMENLHE